MNFLAHSVLAGANSQVVLGSLIGDFVKGVLKPDQLPVDVLLGVRLHRRIDAFSNQLPSLISSAARLPSELRRYAPPCIDVVADHFLANRLGANAEHFAGYRRGLYELALQEGIEYAPQASAFFARAKETDLFGRYADWAVCARTIEHVCSRMPNSKQGAALGKTMSAAVHEQLPQLDADFDNYWPQLAEHAEEFLSAAE